jgi:hypothetical protein
MDYELFSPVRAMSLACASGRCQRSGETRCVSAMQQDASYDWRDASNKVTIEDYTKNHGELRKTCHLRT